MPTFEIEIDGKTYEAEAPDAASAVAAIKKFTSGGATSAAPPGPDRNIPAFVAADMAKSGGIGLVKGGAGLFGLPGDLGQIWDKAGEKATEGIARGIEKLGLVPPGTTDKSLELAQKDREALPRAEREGYVNRIFGLPVPTSKGANFAVTNAFGPYYEPQTAFGRYAQNAAEFIPGAMLAPGSKVAAAIKYGIVPGVASEYVGSMEGVKGTKYEPWARAAAAIGTGGAAALASRPAYVERMVGDAARNVTPAQYAAAEALMQEARNRGINLTAAEAIQAASNGATRLGDVLRIAESTTEGGAHLNPFFAERPGQMSAATGNVLDNIAPRSATPAYQGAQLQEAAQGVLDRIRQRINRLAQPYYDALPNQSIGQAEHAALMNDPSYARAFQQVRNNPELNARIANLPDDSVAVVNEVVKRLDRNATAARQTVTNPAGDNNLAALRGTARTNADNVASAASSDYRTARDIGAQGRETVLDPLQAGPVGQVARTADVAEQAGALMPKSPLPGSEGETRRAVSNLLMENPEATRGVVRSGLEQAANRTVNATDSLARPDQFGGAKFAKDVRGNPQRATNIDAALEAASGPAVRDDVSRLLDVLQATGMRQRPGSLTAFNQEALQDLKGGGVQSIVQAILKPLQSGKDAVARARLGSQSERLADLLMSPDGVRRVQELAARGDDRARFLIQMLATDQAARSGVPVAQ